MQRVFKGSEHLAAGMVTRGELRWNYEAILPDVYVPKGSAHSLPSRIVAAWLWSGRHGVIAGRAAAALHGASWIDPATPIELIGRGGRTPKGVIGRNERIACDEITFLDGLPVTNVARTAMDLARHLPRDQAVQHLDALAHGCGVRAVDALTLMDRYPRARGLRQAETSLGLMDEGGQSPRETWLRLI